MRHVRAIYVSSTLRCTILIAAIHLVAAIAFLHLPFRSWWSGAGLLLCVVSLLMSLRAQRSRRGLLVSISCDGALTVRRGDSTCPARPDGTSVDFGWVIWLVWVEEGSSRKGAAILFRGDHPAPDWRALKVCLRHAVGRDRSAGRDSVSGV